MLNLREEPGINTFNAESLSRSAVRDVPAVIGKIDAPYAKIDRAFGRKEAAHGVNLLKVENVGRPYVGHTLNGPLKEHNAVSLPHGAHDGHNAAAFRKMLIV